MKYLSELAENQGGSLRQGLPLWVLAVGTILAVAGWLGRNAYTDYLSVIEQEYRLLDIRARDREARIAGVLRSIELMLTNIEEDWADNPRMSPQETNRMLRENMRQLPETRNLLITDAHGRVVGTSKEAIIGFDASQREYFVAARDAKAGDPPHVSRPFRTVTNATVITVTHALHDKSGRFLGAISASIDPEKFSELLSFTIPTPDGASLLIHEQGDIIYAIPHPESFVGRDLTGGVAYTEHIRAGQATTRHLNVTKNTGTRVLAIFHKVPASPLIVVVSRQYDAIIADWRRSLIDQFLGFAFVAAIVLFLTALAGKRQAALIDAERVMRSLAFVDGLTGVDNRRRFDETLQIEWRHCQRSNSPLALIMIDIDYFKRYNDHYGHQAGDACLQGVAATLKQNLGRAHDLLARYGGEEFVCLLPECDLAGARAKSEELRAAVAALDLPHEASDTASIVTVSLGVAATIPTAATGPDQLLAEADGQLYEAKQLGRNRTCAKEVLASLPPRAA